jgi:hypothetical protein
LRAVEVYERTVKNARARVRQQPLILCCSLTIQIAFAEVVSNGTRKSVAKRSA